MFVISEQRVPQIRIDVSINAGKIFLFIATVNLIAAEVRLAEILHMKTI
jgi:hypothetical protein